MCALVRSKHYDNKDQRSCYSEFHNTDSLGAKDSEDRGHANAPKTGRGATYAPDWTPYLNRSNMAFYNSSYDLSAHGNSSFLRLDPWVWRSGDETVTACKIKGLENDPASVLTVS